MITNELIRLKATQYRGTIGALDSKEFIFGVSAISYIEKDSDRYVIHLQGDNSLYFVTDEYSKEKLEKLIKENVM